MNLSSCIAELQSRWFPHTTNTGLNRVIELLEQGSPLLIHGSFNMAVPMGCLATQIAWHHPQTTELSQEAGVVWLTRVAMLNPATSHVIRLWDLGGQYDWELRSALLQECKEERIRRQAKNAVQTSTLWANSRSQFVATPKAGNDASVS
jgi:hypothetical protein